MGAENDFETHPIGTKERLEVLEACLDSIKAWCRAYPVAAFPEPDWNKAHAVLRAQGLSLDAISASNMRHICDGIVRIIEGMDLD